MTGLSVEVETMVIATVLMVIALVDVRMRTIQSFYLHWAKRWNTRPYYVERAFRDFNLGKSNNYTAWSKADFFNWYNDQVCRVTVEVNSFYVDEIFADEEEIVWPD